MAKIFGKTLPYNWDAYLAMAFLAVLVIINK